MPEIWPVKVVTLTLGHPVVPNENKDIKKKKNGVQSHDNRFKMENKIKMSSCLQSKGKMAKVILSMVTVKIRPSWAWNQRGRTDRKLQIKLQPCAVPQNARSNRHHPYNWGFQI